MDCSKEMAPPQSIDSIYCHALVAATTTTGRTMLASCEKIACKLRTTTIFLFLILCQVSLIAHMECRL